MARPERRCAVQGCYATDLTRRLRCTYEGTLWMGDATTAFAFNGDRVTCEVDLCEQHGLALKAPEAKRR